MSNPFDKNRHDYSDFFEPRERSKDSHRTNDETSDKQNYDSVQESTYFSYGPFRSQESLEASKQQEPQEFRKEVNPEYRTESNRDEMGSDSILETKNEASPMSDQEMKKSVVYPYSNTQSSAGNTSQKSWNYTGSKKKVTSGFKRMFVSFLAGAVLVGGLMCAADYGNWFTGMTSSSNQQVQNTGGGSGSSGTSAVSQAVFTGDVSPDSFSSIVEMASPAVVKIETYTHQSSQSRYNDEFFNYFFGNRYSQPNQDSEETTPLGMGSGFIFDKDGYILTNEHVVSDADEIYVEIEGYKDKFEAELLGSDYDLDLAVLKISGDSFPTLELGDSDELNVGDWVVAIGNPVGFDHTVSVGVLSQREREISIADGMDERNYEHLLQTDASINPGNSGGPLLNLQGQVIGVNTAVSTDAQGIGFAIPTSTISNVIEKLKNNESIPKPYIGVYLSDIDESYLDNFNLDSTEGSLIVQLEQNGPAARAGIQPGDFVIEVDGEKINNTEELTEIIGNKNVGDKVNMVLIRDGKQIEAIIVVGDRGQS